MVFNHWVQADNTGTAIAATTSNHAPAAHASFTMDPGEFPIFRPRKLLYLSIKPVIPEACDKIKSSPSFKASKPCYSAKANKSAEFILFKTSIIAFFWSTLKFLAYIAA